MLVAEARDDGILLRPAAVLPIEVYTDERRAEFLLSNAVDPADYVSPETCSMTMPVRPSTSAIS
jgi:hypothetical protein